MHYNVIISTVYSIHNCNKFLLAKESVIATIGYLIIQIYVFIFQLQYVVLMYNSLASLSV